MAVTKTHPIKSTLKAAIDYICNPEKTDGKLLVSSYVCTAETAEELGTVPVPSAERMEVEPAALTDRKDRLMAEHRSARSEAQKYKTVKQNVDTFPFLSKEHMKRVLKWNKQCTD